MLTGFVKFLKKMFGMDEGICSEVSRNLYMFLDGELSVEDIRRFEVHFEQCLGCDELRRFEEKLKQIVRENSGSEPVPDQLQNKVVQIIRETDC